MRDSYDTGHFVGEARVHFVVDLDAWLALMNWLDQTGQMAAYQAWRDGLYAEHARRNRALSFKS